MKLLEKEPEKRIRPEEALVHPWIIEKVKIRIQASKGNLYPEISEDEKRKYEDLLDKIKDKITEPIQAKFEVIKYQA